MHNAAWADLYECCCEILHGYGHAAPGKVQRSSKYVLKLGELEARDEQHSDKLAGVDALQSAMQTP